MIEFKSGDKLSYFQQRPRPMIISGDFIRYVGKQAALVTLHMPNGDQITKRVYREYLDKPRAPSKPLGVSGLREIQGLTGG